MEFDDLLVFSFINGVGEKTLEKISEYSTLSDIWNEKDEKLLTVFRSKSILTEFRNKYAKYKEKAEKVRRRLSNDGGYILTRDNSHYPQRLLNSEKSPFFLYCLGNTELLNSEQTAAISGPRNASSVGLSRSFSTAKSLVSDGVTVVSGLATGTDAEAHRASLEFGKTIAVLPYYTPIYPPQNQLLAKRILMNGGLIIAEYFEAFSVKFQLINRDRIIVGLADKLYVPAEYEKDSGTEFTIKCAVDSDKPVYYFKSGKFIRFDDKIHF